MTGWNKDEKLDRIDGIIWHDDRMRLDLRDILTGFSMMDMIF